MADSPPLAKNLQFSYSPLTVYLPILENSSGTDAPYAYCIHIPDTDVYVRNYYSTHGFSYYAALWYDICVIKEQIAEALQRAAIQSGITNPVIDIEHPANPAFGDFSTNLALKYAKQEKCNPMQLAERIAAAISIDALISKVDFIKPGFINIWLQTTPLIAELNAISSSENRYGTKAKKNRKYIIEFGQPNTHKLPHIGHLFSYVYGESLSRIMQHEGITVFRANYQGDVGLHVAKCLYRVKQQQGMLQKLGTLKEKAEFLQKCYQEGSHIYDEDETAKKEINDLNTDIYTKDPGIHALWTETRQWSLDYYKQLEQRLGITYDRSFYESETAEMGTNTVKQNIGKVFEKSEGAVVFKGEPYGLHTRVFINSKGNPTYEAKDMGLMQLKLSETDFDYSIVATASEQNEYWKVVKKAGELVFPELEGKLKHIGFGMINLTTGKMSSRTGHIVNAIQLIEMVRSKIKESFDITDEDLIEKIAMASIKYSFLRSDAFSNISFDLETSISKDGDSGPYLLYSYVRCISVLQKTASAPEGDLHVTESDLNEEERSLLRTLYLFPEVVEKAANSYSPHFVANYLFSTAKLFNLFYQKHSVLNAKEHLAFRLALVKSVSIILKQGLTLLGIPTVEKM